MLKTDRYKAPHSKRYDTTHNSIIAERQKDQLGFSHTTNSLPRLIEAKIKIWVGDGGEIFGTRSCWPGESTLHLVLMGSRAPSIPASASFHGVRAKQGNL